MLSALPWSFAAVALSLILMSSATADDTKVPEPARTIHVSSSSQLTTAIKNARPGDHIALANGRYSGLTVSSSGESRKPLVIRARNLHGAKFTGDIVVKGNHVWVMGLDMGSRSIVVDGSWNRVTRNYFKSTTAHAIYALQTSRNIEIDHNEHAGGTLPNLSLGPHAIFMRYQCSERSRHHVHHNYIHDGFGAAQGGFVAATGIMSGYGTLCGGVHKPMPHTGTIIEYNLIANWSAGYCLRTKSGANIFRFNTCIGVRPGAQNRAGSQNQWIANWMENSGPLRMYDGEQVVIGNRFVGTYLQISSGSLQYLARFASSRYVAASDTIVVGNVGRMRIGTNYANHSHLPASNTLVEAHQTGSRCGQGSIQCGNHTGTKFSRRTNRTIPEAFKLTPAQVGPHAPSAPKW